jgi:hypothetical protein
MLISLPVIDYDGQVTWKDVSILDISYVDFYDLKDVDLASKIVLRGSREHLVIKMKKEDLTVLIEAHANDNIAFLYSCFMQENHEYFTKVYGTRKKKTTRAKRATKKPRPRKP